MDSAPDQTKIIKELTDKFCPEIELGIKNVSTKARNGNLELELAELRNDAGVSNLEVANKDLACKKYAFQLVDKYITTSCDVISELQAEENELYLSVQETLNTAPSRAIEPSVSNKFSTWFRLHKLPIYYFVGIVIPAAICIAISKRPILFKDHPLSRNDFEV